MKNPISIIIQSFIFLFLFLSSISFADELIIEPDMGRAPILSAINNAKSSINLVMYGFTDSVIMQSLINAKNNGKSVTILLEPRPYKNPYENNRAIHLFKEAKINLLWPNPAFKLTHQKTLIIDEQSALIMTFNFTNSSFYKERNFALLLTDKKMVEEIQRIFNADSKHHTVIVKNNDLIWSPDNSREKILNFIQQAQSEIKVYAQDISDYEIIGELAKAARSGIKVQLLLSTPSKKNPHNKRLAYLIKAGVNIHFSKTLIIHAKVIIVDQNRAILGSINLTKPSISANRELAIVIHNPHITTRLLDTFNNDWNGIFQ